MKRTLIALTIATLGMGTATGALAAGKSGPNGHNDYGLCTAYYAGSANGQAHKHQAGPFVALEKAADAAGNNDGTTTDEEMQAFCDATTPGGK